MISSTAQTHWPPAPAQVVVLLELIARNKHAIKMGASGQAVKFLQAALVDAGCHLPTSVKAGKPNGVFGAETLEVLKASSTNRDRYKWDKGKHAELFGMQITDCQRRRESVGI